MQELNEKEFIQYLKDDNFGPYNIYNLDIDYTQLHSVDHYLHSNNDNINTNQLLNILFLDIEVFTKNSGKFPEPIGAKFPINAITIYSTFEKIFRSYILLSNENMMKFPINDLSKLQSDYKNALLKQNYITDEQNIQIKYFVYELDLLKDVWNDIHQIDPVVLSGWNSDEFDIPYIYFRLCNLFEKNEESAKKILSKFNQVKVNKFGDRTIIKIADFSIADLMYLYKPRDEGGLNMGQTQPSYSLDWVSESEIDLKKLEYNQEGFTLDRFYLENPVDFLLYNIMDVCLVVQLNNKLKHIENHNMYRRLMKTSFDSSLRGSSILFDTFVLYELKKNNKFVRFGINDETNINITEYDINKIVKPTGKKAIKWNVTSLNSNIIKRVANMFPGAYVKASPGKLFTDDDGLLMILDAQSLYPSMIRENNISFDSFFGRIIDPNIYKIFQAIKQNLGNDKILNQYFSSILELSIDHVEYKNPTNKNDHYQYNYYITCYTFEKLIKNCKNFDNLLQPTNYSEYILLRNYFILILDMMEKLAKNSTEYNSFCYDYFINQGKEYKTDILYIIENFNETNIRIIKVPVSEFSEYLKKNNLIVTLSGALFHKHEIKTGLFSDWLKTMAEMRKHYKDLRDKFKEEKGYGCEEYKFYNMIQNATKIAMNTSYGLYGLNSFRYSNHHLAKAITTEGRLRLKICQQISEMVIEQEKQQ